jgi:WD40 repeat protein
MAVIVGHQRFLVAVGVARYPHLPDDQQLPEAELDVARIVKLFGDGLGYQRVLPEIGADPTAGEVRKRISEWFHSPERRAEDVVVLYFAGHGTTASTGTHYLCTTDYEQTNPAATSLRTADLLEWLAGTPVQRLLVILDTCKSGQGTGDLSALARALEPAARMSRTAGFYFVASARPQESAYDGVFAEACERALQEERWGGTTQPFLHPDALVEAVNGRTAPLQVATSASSHVTGFPEFLPNPRFDSRAVQGWDVETLRRLHVAPAELKAHWSPRSRGVEFEAQPGWYFQGRHAALRELVAWLAAPEGDGRGRVVTGQPGSGKSAVLARLVLLSDPETRRRTPLEGIPKETIPPAHAVDVAIHARGKSLHQVADALAEGAAVPRERWAADGTQSVEEKAALLVDALRARPGRLAVVVDALDEAAEPARVAGYLLRPLTALPSVRLLVGTRVNGIAALGASIHVVDLDCPPYAERRDLAAYVHAQLLCIDDHEVHTPYRGRADLAGIVAGAVAESAFPNFLVARIVSQNLRAAAEPVDTNARGWRRRLPTSVGEAFHEYLARFGPDEERVRHVLAALAYAEGSGLPWDALWAPLASALWGRKYDDGDVSWVLAHAGSFVSEQNDAGRSTYRLFHEALADYLREMNRGREAEVHLRFTRTLVEHTPRSTEGQTDWPRAHPYVRTHLATHAATAGQIDALGEDPLFLLAAEPDGLLRALPAGARGAEVYRRAVHQIRGRPLEEGASYLELVARQTGHPGFADRIAALVPNRPWSVPWAHWLPQAPHRVLDGHEGGVSSVAVGEVDGRAVIISGSDDRTVRVWDLATGKARGEPPRGHAVWVCSVAVGEVDGRAVIVSGSADRAVRVWDLATGKARGEPLCGHEGWVNSVAVGEVDGRAVIVSGSYDWTVRVWDLATGQARGEPLRGHESGVNSVAVGEVDGRAVIVSGSGDRTVRVWDLATGQPRGEPLRGHEDEVRSVAVGVVDGRAVIVSGSDDRTVRVWDLATGQARGEPLRGHEFWVYSVAVGEVDGREIIVSGSYDRTVRVWDLATGQERGEPLRGHESGVNSVAVGEVDGRAVIVSCSDDRTVCVWDLTSEQARGEALRGHEVWVYSVAVGEVEGRAVIVSGNGDRTVRVRDLATGQPRGEPLRGHEERVRSVALGEVEGRAVIVSGSGDRTVRLWDLAAGQPRGEPLCGHEGGVSSVAVGEADGRAVIVSGSDDRTVRVWDLATGQRRGEPLRGHEWGVNSVAVGEVDGRAVIVSASDDRTVRVWDLATGQPRGKPLRGHEAGVGSVALDKVGGRAVIVSGSVDRTVRVWDLATGQPRGEPLRGHEQWVTAVAVGEVGGRAVIVSGSSDRTVRLWDSRSAMIIDTGSRVLDVRLTRSLEIAVATAQGILVLRPFTTP